MNEPVLVNATVGKDKEHVKKLAVAGLGLLLLVVVVLPRLLGGGGSDAEGFDDFPVTATPPTAGVEAPEETIEVVGAFSTRSPFTPRAGGGGASLVSAVSPAEAAPAVPAEAAPPALPAFVPDPMPMLPVLSAPTPTPAPAPAPAPLPAPAPAPPAPAPSSTPSVPGPQPRVERDFTLVEVYTDGGGLPAARVRVGDKELEVAVGQDFEGSYRVLSLDRNNKCGVFLFGDRRFSLCEGETTRT